jgi:hypothetical protein
MDGGTGGGAGATVMGMMLGPDFLPPVQAVDMQVTIGFGSTQRAGYSQAPLYATYTNLGPDTATNIQATITLPAGIPYTVTRNGDFMCSSQGQTVTCTLATLAPGASEIVEIFLQLPRIPQGMFSVSAAVAGGGFDYVAANNQATLSAEITGFRQLSGDGFGCAMGGPGEPGARAAWLLLLLPALLWAARRRVSAPGLGGGLFGGLFGALLGASGCTPTPPPPLNVQVTVSGQGTVTSSDGAISCGAQCAISAMPGTLVQLTATPTSGQRFDHWDGRCQGTVPACDLSVYNDVTATATFAPIPTSCFDGIKNADESDVNQGSDEKSPRNFPFLSSSVSLLGKAGKSPARAKAPSIQS